MKLVSLDLETAGAERIWDYGPGFVRLAGYAVDGGPVVTTTDIGSVVALLHELDVIVIGHNILAFDLPALALHHGLDLDRMVAEDRVIDTLLVARQNDPPLSGNVDSRRYNLDSVARRVLGEGKVVGDGGSVLKALATAYGGFEMIPVDHPDYVRYLVQDVELVRALAKHLVVDDYVRREHLVMHRLNAIPRNGFRVDVALVERMVAEQAERVEVRKRELHGRYGLPLTGKAPQRSKAGIEALEKAFADVGVQPPRTTKGALATGKDALTALEAGHSDNTALVELCQTLRALNGERSTAQTILDHTGPDGRVHPDIDARQATGRISVTRPGLTVMGKRDRANIIERALLLPDESDVLLPVDLAAIDGRAVAIHCGDPDYAALFAPGKDLHDEMAAAIFGEDGWDRTAGHHPRRGDAKAISHATNYGMGAAGLARNAGIDVAEAERQLAVLAMKFPGLAAWKAAVREEARGQVLVTAFGRRVRVQPGKEYTQAPAFLGQGTARDLMMEGLLRLPEWLVPRLRAVVHDELVFSVPIDRVDDAREQILGALQFAVNGTPVLAEAGDPGSDWADCYRSEKPKWPEVARAHREMSACEEFGCVWHGR
ncbi:DNA polymerase [Gordonia amicalis]|uniref:DNA polymerase n=1 Tax=Gordonia amicalis TaxID=89053 RepID=UPI0024BA6E29|nr:DNA polymerase [Gordonia amicalis]MDJ0454068.1 DNA polymerase [Gordonia amicalis]MDV7077212.1 DNA polymerase [Gordonia amicalis]